MEEEESAPIVAPAQKSNVPLPKRKAWNEQQANKDQKQEQIQA